MASTLINTTSAPTITINPGRSPSRAAAISMAVGGVRYSAMAARLASTWRKTKAQAR